METDIDGIIYHSLEIADVEKMPSAQDDYNNLFINYGLFPETFHLYNFIYV